MIILLFKNKTIEHMTDGINEALVNKLSQLNSKISLLDTPTKPNWGGWGEGLTLNRPSHTSIYYPN